MGATKIDSDHATLAAELIESITWQSIHRDWQKQALDKNTGGIELFQLNKYAITFAHFFTITVGKL